MALILYQASNLLSTIFLIASTLLAMGQNITDVDAIQEGKSVVVSYSLDKNSPSVTLHVSTDGGKTYSAALKAVSGGLTNVSAGRRSIRWDVLAEREKLVGNNIVFKVVPKTQYEYVDLGLSVMWAASNVGALTHVDHGGSYQWAGVKNVSNKKIYVAEERCPYHDGADYKTHWTKYVPSNMSWYWSSTLDLDYLNRGCSIEFSSYRISTQSGDRYYGFSVRPVMDK